MDPQPWTLANIDKSSNAILLVPDDEYDFIFHENDLILQIGILEKPGKVMDWWNEQVIPNKKEWTHPLSEWEKDYIRTFTDTSTPEPLRMREAVNSESLSPDQRAEAQKTFSGANFAELYSNYENRRRIKVHYIMTHPVTIQMQLMGFRLFRDINPVHFAFERGWQMGCGREMFTDEPVSRLGAAAEFFTALAANWAIGKALMLSRGMAVGTITRPSQGLITNEARFAQTTYRNSFSKQAGAKFSGWTVDQAADFLRKGLLHPRHVPIDFIVRDGKVLILNTRSAQALTQAGIPRSQWFAINRTGNAAFEARLTGQLLRNKLTSEGTATVTREGK